MILSGVAKICYRGSQIEKWGSQTTVAASQRVFYQVAKIPLWGSQGHECGPFRKPTALRCNPYLGSVFPYAHYLKLQNSSPVENRQQSHV